MVIWIALLIAGLLGLVVIRFRHRAPKPITWPQVEAAGALDDAGNANELMKLFFLVDSIHPADYLANYFDVSGAAPLKVPLEPGKPTRSAVAFEQGLNAPPGYPRWFLAAYPDVALWLAAKDENSMLRITAEALYGDEGAKELVRIHGLKRIGELMDEKFENFDLPQLRRLVTSFCRDTRKQLECAKVVKEQRPGPPRWYESGGRRQPVNSLGERVLSD